jgi:hypothetical protein
MTFGINLNMGKGASCPETDRKLDTAKILNDQNAQARHQKLC